jgi:hypothetical protein
MRKKIVLFLQRSSAERGRAASKQVYHKNNLPTDRNPATAGQRMKSKSIRQNKTKALNTDDTDQTDFRGFFHR